MVKYIFKEQKILCVALLIMMVVGCVMEVGTVCIMSLCIELAVSGNIGKASIYTLTFLAYIVLYFIVDFYGRKLKYTVLKNARNNLRNDILNKISNFSHKKFYERTYSEWSSVLLNDVSLIDESCFGTMLTVFPDIIMLIISVFLLVYISPSIALFIIALAVAQMVVPKIMGGKIAKSKERLSKKNGDFMNVLTDHLQGFDLLKSFNLIKYAKKEVENAGNDLEMERYRSRFLTSVAMLFSFSFGQVIYIGVYLFGAILTAKGYISIGAMIAASQLSVYIIGPLESMSGYVAEIISARNVISSIEKVVESTEEESGGSHIENLDQGIRLKNVSFSYGNVKVLEDTDYIFEKGKKYLLNSPSGTGKTTLVKLMTKKILPQRGKIFLDEINIDDIEWNSYTRLVSICDQVTFVFHDTLRNNITLYDEKYSDKEIYEAIKSVGLDYLFSKNGYSLYTVLNPRGDNLSGGEKQRIALARLQLLRAPFWILDESFANLDYDSKIEILEKIVQEKERTVLYISHQITPEIIKMFDEVIEVRDYKIRRKAL